MASLQICPLKETSSEIGSKATGWIQPYRWIQILVKLSRVWLCFDFLGPNLPTPWLFKHQEHQEALREHPKALWLFHVVCKKKLKKIHPDPSILQGR